jgi:uncharacterized protein (UPF0147 family)
MTDRELIIKARDAAERLDDSLSDLRYRRGVEGADNPALTVLADMLRDQAMPIQAKLNQLCYLLEQEAAQ